MTVITENTANICKQYRLMPFPTHILYCIFVSMCFEDGCHYDLRFYITNLLLYLQIFKQAV